MAGISFSGIASGLDTELIIESLLVRQQSRINSISSRVDDENAKKRALNDVKGALERFEGTISGLVEDGFQNRQVESGDEDVVTAEAGETASLGEQEIEVSTLARRSVALIGKAQSSATAQIGAGTLAVNLQGGDSFNFTLTDATATLTDLAQEINDQAGDTFQTDVIEVDPGSFQLVLSTKDTGASVNIQDDTNGGGSSTLSGFDATFLDAAQTNSNGITTEQTGQNASFTVNGVSISRASNEIDDVLQGVTLTLRGVSSGGSTTLKIDSNEDEIIAKLDEFVNGYNDVLSQIDRVTERETGVLRGDPDLQGLKSNLRSLITRFVPNIDQINLRDDGSVGLTSLSQIGFETDEKTGRLNIDKDELKEALEDNFQEVQNLFLGGSTSSNPNVSLSANVGQAFSGQIALDTINDTATIDGQSFALNRVGETLSFGQDTPYAGIILIAGGVSSSNVTLEISAGLASVVEDQVGRFTDFSGIINDRTRGIDSKTRGLDKQLEQAEDRLESERARLTRVFSQAEQAISALQGLQASLGAQTTAGFGLGGA